MAYIPEDIIQYLMQTTGLSREEAEKEIAKSLSEMANAPVFKSSETKHSGGPKPMFDEDNYPHYLPSDHIMKYTIRVSLKNSAPAIWRKFECPSNISLRHLTELIIHLMGWENKHLNMIKCKNDIYYVPFYQYDEDYDFGETYYQEEYMLSDILAEKGKTVKLEYDFGDSWLHDIRLSSIAEYKDDESHGIVFKGGKCACPPEDCGGIWGYAELLELCEKRKSRKRLTADEKRQLEWCGIEKHFDPEDFDEYECEDICDYFSESEDDDEPVATGGIPLIDHNLEVEAKEELAKLSPIYNNVLSLAFRIRELEPWEDLNDSDIYAIKMHDGSEVYVATMGYGGESYDVQMYDGQESLQLYLDIANKNAVPEFEVMESHAWGKYKSIMFQDPVDMLMQPVQYRMIEEWAKAHDITIKDEHGYPFPQHFQPHRYPTMKMSDEELLRMKEALEAIVWLSQEILNADELTDLGFKGYREYATKKGGKVVPLIVKTENGYTIERTKLPGCVTKYDTVSLSESDIQSLSSLKKSGTQLCRLLHVPGYIGCEDDVDNAYSALILVSIDKKTEDISLTEPFQISDTYEHDVMCRFIDSIQEKGVLPQRIVTDNQRTADLLRDFCNKLGIILELKRTPIPQLTQFCQFAYSDEAFSND